MRILVTLPTHNEGGNIEKILDMTLNSAQCDILVVDDNSIDSTRDQVRSFFSSKRVFMIEREAKLGLGTAYITGFKWGLMRGYELFFEMDADLSHDPNMIPHFVSEINKGYDVVVGSRYMKGTISVVGWDFRRLLLSKFANFYIKSLTPLKRFTDVTSGFRCYRREVFDVIALDQIKSNGYAFQIEMLYRCYMAGLRIGEIPIIFYERNGGSSKMDKRVVREAMILPFRLLYERLFFKNILKKPM